jgi:hypothetical protein
MDLLYTLMCLEDRINRLRLKRTKKVFLTCKEIQELMRNGEPIPTNIFNAERKEYIVKSRTIYGSDKRR